jgi:hypothetical protein
VAGEKRGITTIQHSHYSALILFWSPKILFQIDPIFAILAGHLDTLRLKHLFLEFSSVGFTGGADYPAAVDYSMPGIGLIVHGVECPPNHPSGSGSRDNSGDLAIGGYSAPWDSLGNGVNLSVKIHKVTLAIGLYQSVPDISISP